MLDRRMQLELDHIEATIAYNEAVAKEDAEAIEKAEKRLNDILAERHKHIKENQVPEPPPKSLMERASFARYVDIARGEELYDGAERELNKEMGFSREQFPIELLLGPLADDRHEDRRHIPQGQIEDRVDAFTNIDTSQQINNRPIMQQYFKPAILGRIGVSMVSMPMGETSFAWISTGATADFRKRGEAFDATALEIATIKVEPRRLTTRIGWNIEEIAQVGSNLESVLRENARLTIDNELQEDGMQGDHAADDTTKTPAFTGIITQIGSISTDNTPNDDTKATALDWMTYLNGLRKTIEMNPGGGNVVVGIDTQTAMLTTLVNTNEYYPVTKLLRDELGIGVIDTLHMPAQRPATSTHGAAQNALYIARPENAIMAMWNAGEVIYNPYNEDSSAQKTLTIHVLTQMAYPRVASGTSAIYGWRGFDAINTNKT